MSTPRFKTIHNSIDSALLDSLQQLAEPFGVAIDPLRPMDSTRLLLTTINNAIDSRDVRIRQLEQELTKRVQDAEHEKAHKQSIPQDTAQIQRALQQQQFDQYRQMQQQYDPQTNQYTQGLLQQRNAGFDFWRGKNS